MKRSLVAVVASAVVAIAIVVVVLVYGVIDLPRYPSLASRPDDAIAGLVAYTQTDGRLCLRTISASGRDDRELTCEAGGRSLEYGSAPGWTADGRLVVHEYGPSGDAWVVLDARTGRVAERIAVAEGKLPPASRLPDRTQRADGATLVWDSPERGVATISVRRDGVAHEVVRVDGPRDHALEDVQWSPDGRWFAARDSERRLIVFAEDGSRGRVLATGVDAASWFVAGDATYAVDLATLRGP